MKHEHDEAAHCTCSVTKYKALVDVHVVRRKLNITYLLC